MRRRPAEQREQREQREQHEGEGFTADGAADFARVEANVGRRCAVCGAGLLGHGQPGREPRCYAHREVRPGSLEGMWPHLRVVTVVESEAK